MATFALFYNRADVAALVAEVSNPGLTAQERNIANRYWNGGMRDWSSAPQAPQQVPYACVVVPFNPTGQVEPWKTITDNGNGTWTVCDPQMTAIVVSGTQVSKAGLVTFLRQIGQKYLPGTAYLLGLADDIETQAVEPWPPA